MSCALVCFFFNDTATTEIYTLSLHDALPISPARFALLAQLHEGRHHHRHHLDDDRGGRSEEHTSELQSRVDLVCRLLLEKKKTQQSSKQTQIHVDQHITVTRPQMVHSLSYTV